MTTFYNLLAIIGSTAALSNSTLANVALFGKNFFDLYDFLTSNILLPVGGLLVSVLDETDLALRAAREQGVYVEMGMIARNERQIRALRRRSIHTLNESRRELQPLYDVLRRASAIAHGATLALGRLRQMKQDDWVVNYMVQADRAGIECPPTDAVLRHVINEVVNHPPTPPPVLSM